VWYLCPNWGFKWNCNKNLDDCEEYVLIEREVEAIAKSSSDALEKAVDNLTKEHQSEFLRNAKIYEKCNGKKIKVTADVWGTQNANVNITTTANVKVELNAGDKVIFYKKGKIVDGKIIGLNADFVIVEYGKRNKRMELKYDDTTNND
jgi:hypothetical protein